MPGAGAFWTAALLGLPQGHEPAVHLPGTLPGQGRQSAASPRRWRPRWPRSWRCAAPSMCRRPSSRNAGTWSPREAEPAPLRGRVHRRQAGGDHIRACTQRGWRTWTRGPDRAQRPTSHQGLHHSCHAWPGPWMSRWPPCLLILSRCAMTLRASRLPLPAFSASPRFLRSRVARPRTTPCRRQEPQRCDAFALQRQYMVGDHGEVTSSP